MARPKLHNGLRGEIGYTIPAKRNGTSGKIPVGYQTQTSVDDRDEHFAALGPVENRATDACAVGQTAAR